MERRSRAGESRGSKITAGTEVPSSFLPCCHQHDAVPDMSCKYENNQNKKTPHPTPQRVPQDFPIYIPDQNWTTSYPFNQTLAIRIGP